MRTSATPSVDHLSVLLTVVEAGSFAGAARHLRRATSAISYAIDTLEATLGVTLFDRGTTRKPKLTCAGEAVVSEARLVAHSIEVLRTRVRGLVDGLEPEVSLVVDSMFLSDQLIAALDDFYREFPTVPVRLLVRTLGGVERIVRDGDACIGVGCIHHMDGTGLRQIHIGGVRLVPVVAPTHPLASMAEVSSLASREYVQLVLADQLAANAREGEVVSLTTWRVSHLLAMHKLILRGVGWGGLPEPMVRPDIESGSLVQLNLSDWRGGEYWLQIVHKLDAPPGTAGRWLIERLLTLRAGRGAHINRALLKPAAAKNNRRALKRPVSSQIN